MHICEAHKEMLPETISPMVMPDTPAEADLIVILLDSGLYPTRMSISEKGKAPLVPAIPEDYTAPSASAVSD
jgi:hypothetical protein